MLVFGASALLQALERVLRTSCPGELFSATDHSGLVAGMLLQPCATLRLDALGVGLVCVQLMRVHCACRPRTATLLLTRSLELGVYVVEAHAALARCGDRLDELEPRRLRAALAQRADALEAKAE